MSTQDQVFFFLEIERWVMIYMVKKDREMIELDGDRVIYIGIYRDKGRDIELFIDQAR